MTTEDDPRVEDDGFRTVLSSGGPADWYWLPLEDESAVDEGLDLTTSLLSPAGFA